MPVPLATVADMERRLGVAPGSLSGADLVRATEALGDASALVRQAAFKTWLDGAGALLSVPAVVVTVTVAAALRQFRNPDGLTGESVTGYSAQRSPDQATVTLTPDEIATVRAAASVGQGRPFVGSIRTPSAYRSPDPPADRLICWDLP